MQMEFQLPMREVLVNIRHIRTFNYAPDVYYVEWTVAAEPDASTRWMRSEPGTEVWANAFHMRLATAAREAQVFKPKITETTRI